MPVPYIGVTGFMTREEVQQALEAVPTHTQRKLMVGVLVSQKTMRGEPNKWPQRYPLVEDVTRIFPDDPRALNLIHYNTKEPKTLFEQLVHATMIGGQQLHGFQLNIAWPDIKELEAYKKLCPGKIIVLQIGGHAFEQVHNNPGRLAYELTYYNEVVDYVLLDPSGGLGKPFDPFVALEYLHALRAQKPKLTMGFGVAGGLSSTTLDLIKPILPEFPEISGDAEGRLRDTNDNLNIPETQKYIKKFFELVEGT